MSKLRIILPLVLVLGLIGFGLTRVLRAPKGAASNVRNVVLISIDTCRPDHLSCYGYTPANTPHIDALAAESVLFQNAITPSPLARSGHASMLTGAIPPYHGVRDDVHGRLEDDQTTLAEILRDAGFKTGAAVSSVLLNLESGLDQGFDGYDAELVTGEGQSATQRLAGDTAWSANDWLDRHAEETFFLFVHFFDPHIPYEPQHPYTLKFKEDPYAAEIAYTDYSVGQIVKKLKDLGLYDSTLIILTSNHGEMLGEHGEDTHGHFVYQGALRVPLIVKMPGETEARTVEQLVSLVDLVPTVCAQAGLEAPRDIQGEDLSPLLEGAQSALSDRLVYFETLQPQVYYGTNALQGVMNNRWKYIRSTRPELYDLVEDPGEETDLAGREVDTVTDLDEKLQKILFQRETEFDPQRDDPKDVIDLHLEHEQAAAMLLRGEISRARTLFQDLVERRPKFALGHRYLGSIAQEQGDFARAIPHLQRSIELDPEDSYVRDRLGAALAIQGDYTEALYHFREVLKRRPDYVGTEYRAGHALSELDRREEAIPHFRRAAEMEPAWIDARISLGAALQATGKLDEAIAEYRYAAELEPNNHRVLINLGNAIRSKGNLDEAIRLYRQVLESDPESVAAHFHLGVALDIQGNKQEAAAAFAQAVDIRPGFGVAHQSLATVLAGLGRTDGALFHFRESLKTAPKSGRSLNGVAWILATHPDPSKRNPEEAIELAHRACAQSGFESPASLDTLAVAYAAGGDFPKAIEYVNKAIEKASALGSKEMTQEIQTHLALFQRGQPYVDRIAAVPVDPLGAIPLPSRDRGSGPSDAETERARAAAEAQQRAIDESIRQAYETLKRDPENAAAYFKMGSALVMKGNVDDGARALGAAVELKPRWIEARIRLGSALDTLGRVREAADEFRRALELSPSNPLVLIKLGNAVRSAGDFDGAIGHYREALEYDPGSHEATFNMAIAFSLQGKLEEAVRQYKNTIKINPDYAPAHAHFGMALSEIGEPDAALSRFREAIRLNPDDSASLNGAAWIMATRADPEKREPGSAIQLAERACELTGYRNPGLLDTLAAVYAANGRFRQAIQTAQKALKLAADAENEQLAVAIHSHIAIFESRQPFVDADVEASADEGGAITDPARAGESDSELADVHNALGMKMAEKGDLNGALRHFRDAVKANPNHPDAHFNTARALIVKGRMGSAITHFRKTVELKPDWIDARISLAIALSQDGKAEEAVAELHRALELDPENPRVLVNLGNAARARGQVEEGIGHYRQALEFNPRFALAHFSLADALQSQGDQQGAIRHFREVVRADPNFTVAHWRLATALAEQGEADSSLSHFRAVLRLDPDHAQALNGAAWILATRADPARREPDEAFRLATRACKLTQDRSAPALDTLAATFAARGRFKRAEDTARDALDIAAATGDEDLARKIREHIELYRKEQALVDEVLQ